MIKNNQNEDELLIETSDSDDEHLERGHNWRCRLLFNGLVQDYDLQPDCERPQSDEGRTFPLSKTKIPDYSIDEMNEFEKDDCFNDEIEISKNKASDSIVNKISRGYVMGHTWVSKKLISADPDLKKVHLNTNFSIIIML